MSTWGGQNAVQTNSRVPARVQLECCLSLASYPRATDQPYVCVPWAWASLPGKTPGPTGITRLEMAVHWLWKPRQPQLFRATQAGVDEACPEMEHSAGQLQWGKANMTWDSSFLAGISWDNKKLLWVCSAAHFVSSSARFYHFSAWVANAQQCDEPEELTDQAEN